MDNKIRPGKQISLTIEDVLDQNVYQKVWLPVGDDMVNDIVHLLGQNRIN